MAANESLMPMIKGLTDEELDMLIAFVERLHSQRTADK